MGILGLLLDEDKAFYHRAFYNETFIHPMAAAAVLALGIATLSLSRRFALVPFIALVCFIPSSQRISVAGLDFSLIRILLIFSWARLMMRKEWKGLRLVSLDKVLIAWAIGEACIYVLQRRDSAGVIYMAGKMGEALGIYFLIRCLVRDWRDVSHLLMAIAAVMIPLGIAYTFEWIHGKNIFYLFGGVRRKTPIREGKLRCLGAIGNPILSGCFAAAMMPLVGAHFWSKNGKPLALLGLTACVVIILSTASSTPLGAMMACIAGAVAFKVRMYMREIRWGIFLTLLGLHLVMNNPVWHLITRIDFVGGSTGWHRYVLIDAFVNHTREWFLLGVRSTGHWGRGLFDITNQFVLEGVNGGIVGFSLFIAVLAMGYAYSGRIVRAAGDSAQRRALGWGLGVSLFVHNASFFGVSYFGQMQLCWHLPLALLGSLGAHILSEQESRETSPEVATVSPTLQAAPVFSAVNRHRRRLVAE